ncbi:hypothetical protein KZX45_00040 [Georgenia sp. EYE_87]|uniref:hypothetical protein n=1 Tax=Georgenia sp. EYE_87 TaxID=2853448 RepID=UPI002003F6AB|nr:hypothetical protein [Georgenia sp. EYE_87]MCK6208933.1 hypothetical protein [Georgenia sp. EYE_87]
MHQGIRMVEGRQFREAALEQLQVNLPGFPPERYGTELDDALARIDEDQVVVLVRREQMIAEARERDLLNAVFSIYYFNSRYSRHDSEVGLGPIKLADALGDLYTHEQLSEAAARANALITDGIRMGYGHLDWNADMDHLRRSHPGFSDRALGDALDWGRFFGR